MKKTSSTKQILASGLTLASLVLSAAPALASQPVSQDQTPVQYSEQAQSQEKLATSLLSACCCACGGDFRED